MSESYPPHSETKWQKAWTDSGAFQQGKRSGRPTFYCLEMYPYPSGKMHMGHVRNYTIGDSIARYRRLAGFDVLYPMGFDSFGMPAENAAKEIGAHPREITDGNIKTITAQLQRMGFSYDWSRRIMSHDEKYYRWNQWFFLRMLEQGLVYRKHAAVNWDPVEQSVLANEQVIDGKGWRSGAVVEQREIPQWFIRITDYAQQLWDGLDDIDYPEHVKSLQKDWLGRSEGATIGFAIEGDTNSVIEVFTTRPDTIFGVTFLTLAPEHPLAEKLLIGTEFEDEWSSLRDEVRVMSDFDRGMLKEKKGVATGRYAIHPLTGDKIPIWIGNFVIASYGTGAVMAVPAHDQRDFDFAKEYEIPIHNVLAEKQDAEVKDLEKAFEGHGWMINSPRTGFDGLFGEDAKRAVIDAIEKENCGKGSIQWKIRDWLISRQRYWGTPIPIIHCESCGAVPVPDDQLPVKLPDDVSFSVQGNPLESSPTFQEADCPSCGKASKRETDTMDTFIDSSWYFLRYTDALNDEKCFEPEVVNHWMNVDFYCGGIEHAQMHLIYSRFWTKALRDLGLHDIDEPFQSLLCQGMVTHATFAKEDGTWVLPTDVNIENGVASLKSTGEPIIIGRVEKMSKSKKNVVDPASIIENYGADTLRLFILFAAQPVAEMEWSDQGITSAWRQLNLLYGLPQSIESWGTDTSEIDAWLSARLSQRVNQWRELMECNDLRGAVEISHFEIQKDLNWYRRRGGNNRDLGHSFFETWAHLLSPATPHLAEMWWNGLGNGDLLAARTLQETGELSTGQIAVLDRETWIRNFLEHARRVSRIAEKHIGKPPNSARIVICEEWKRGLAIAGLNHIISGENVKSFAANISNLKLVEQQDLGQVMALWGKRMLPQIFKWSDEDRRILLGALNEAEVISAAKEFICSELGLSSLEVGIDEESKSAMPMAPAVIYS
jgi:leucyl-tRNA synthetase